MYEKNMTETQYLPYKVYEQGMTKSSPYAHQYLPENMHEQNMTEAQYLPYNVYEQGMTESSPYEHHNMPQAQYPPEDVYEQNMPRDQQSPGSHIYYGYLSKHVNTHSPDYSACSLKSFY